MEFKRRYIATKVEHSEAAVADGRRGRFATLLCPPTSYADSGPVDGWVIADRGIDLESVFDVYPDTIQPGDEFDVTIAITKRPK